MVSLTRSGAARALLDHPEGWLLFFLLSHVRDAHLWNGLLVRPSEKPGERQRAWLITGEPSNSDEPGRQHPETKSRSGDAERSDPHELN